MKNFLYSAILLLAALTAGCKDSLPEAVFGLHEIATLTATANDSKVLLTWSQPEDKTPDEYLIKWTSNAGKAESGSVVTDKSATRHDITGLTNDITYTFTIQGRYAGRLSAPRSANAKPTDMKYKVENLTAAAGTEKVRLTWVKPISDELTSYVVSISPGDRQIQIPDPDTERLVIDKLTNDTEYTFSVVAVYTYGASQAATATAIPGVVIPISTNTQTIIKLLPCRFAYNDMYFIKDVVQSVVWDFGDGAPTSTELSPSHAFTATGDYNITITVTYNDLTTEQGSLRIAIEDYRWDNVQLNYKSLSGYIKTSNPVFSSDALTLYIATSTPGANLFAIDMITGESKWAYTMSTTKVTYGGGPLVGPDGTIYQGADDKIVYAVNPNGSEKWKRTLDGVIGAFPAMAEDGTLYVLANGSKLYALNPQSGAEKWSTAVDVSSTGSAVLVGKDKNIYVGTALGIYCYSPSGTQIWSSEQMNVTERGSFAANGTTLYAALKAKGGLAAINMQTGQTEWTYPVPGAADSYFPIVDKAGTIYFGCKTAKAVFAINSDGTKKWETNVGHDLIYNGAALGENGVIYFGTHGAVSSKFYVIGLNCADGSTASKTASGHIQAASTIGPDGRFYSGVFNSSAQPNLGFIEAYDIGTSLEKASWSVRGGDMQGTNRQR